MDASAIIALCSAAVAVVGAVLGASWALASRLGTLAVSVEGLVRVSEAHGQQLDRIEVEARDRSQTLSGVRDRLAALEGSLGARP